MFYVVDKERAVVHPALTAGAASGYIAGLPADEYILIKSDDKGDRIIKVETMGFDSVRKELEAA
jgi:hypothetical protein